MALRASQINGCGWCTDIHTKEAAAAGETPVRLHRVAAWRESTVFTEAERAALALTEEGTRLADAQHGVSDETWAQVRKHYDDDQIAALVSVVALINATDRLAVYRPGHRRDRATWVLPRCRIPGPVPQPRDVPAGWITNGTGLACAGRRDEAGCREPA